MSNNSRTTRKDELEVAVARAVYNTVDHCVAAGCEDMKSNDDMMAHFLQNLYSGIDSKGKVSVEFMGVDYQEGLLDVYVTEEYLLPTGKTEDIAIRKTAIYE